MSCRKKYSSHITIFKKAALLAVSLSVIGTCPLMIRAADDAAQQEIIVLDEMIKLLREKGKYRKLQQAYIQLGALYYENRQYRDAIQILEKAAGLNFRKKVQTMIYLRMGECYEKLCEYEKAIPLYQQSLRLMPKNPSIHNALGRAFGFVELYDKSLIYYQQAHVLDRKNVEALEGLGSVYQIQGLYDRAIPYFQETIVLNPDNDRVYLKLSQIYEEENDLEQAVTMQLKAVAFQPDVPGYVRLGFLYTRQKDFEKATAFFNQAHDLDPNNDEVFLHIGMASFNNGSYEKALEAFDQALILNPLNALAYFYRAQIHYHAGAISFAIKDCEKAYDNARSTMLSDYSIQLLQKLQTISTR